MKKYNAQLELTTYNGGGGGGLGGWVIFISSKGL
jgi:hypothetical protein